MSTTINQDVIKAREVVAGYKELNKNTVEERSYSDPVLKLRRYKKVVLDLNSIQFKKLYGKKELKEKPVKAVKFIAPKIVKVKPKKVIKKPILRPKVEAPVKIKVKKIRFNPESTVSKAYNLHLEGKTNKEIGLLLGITLASAASKIRDRKVLLGLPITPKKYVDENDVLNLFRKGKSIQEIADELNIANATVYAYLRNKKTPEQRILECEEVYRHIQAKCKLNQSTFIFSKMITPMKCKYKYDISIMEIYKYCNELAEQGKIIIPDEPLAKHKGRKIEIIVA